MVTSNLINTLYEGLFKLMLYLFIFIWGCMYILIVTYYMYIDQLFAPRLLCFVGILNGILNSGLIG